MASAPCPKPLPSSTPARGHEPAYTRLREHHQYAYHFLTQALEIDESGLGDKAEALDWYSKGVAKLEDGIAMETNASGEELVKVERLKKKMATNLEMARGRTSELLDGGELKWKSRVGSKAPDPTASLMANVRPREPLRPKHHASKIMPAPIARPSNPYPATRPSKPKNTTPPVEKKKLSGHSDSTDSSVPRPHPDVSRLKGVDKKLAQTLLDEVMESDTKITWDDIVGLELPKRALHEIVILPAQRPDLFMGLRTPSKGLLLFGPPGNGKTMLAKAVAHESNCTFFNISASALTSKWVGEGEKLVKALFVLARELQPSIIFIDEVDALLGRRSESDHDAMRRLKNEFLLSFDGLHSTDEDRFLVMAATNRPQELDDAALRRFEKRIYVPLPGAEARKNVLSKLLTKHRNKINEAELDRLSGATRGYSGSDLTALAKDAALGPIRELDYEQLKELPADKIRPILLKDFEQSMRLVRPSVSPELLHMLEQWNKSYGVST